MHIHKRQQGFTVLELLLVVVIIGILIALISITYTGIREKERNSVRRDNVTILQLQLEHYFVPNLKYPTISQLNDSSWRSKNLKNFDENVLRDPNSTSLQLVDKAQPRAIAYIARALDGSPCDNIKVDCKEYTIITTLEGGGQYSKSSLY